MNRIYFAWRTLQERFVQYVAAALMLGLTLLALLEVIRRYGFGVSFPWQQDAVTFGILAAVFLFFSITQSRRAHLRVSIGLLLLRKKGGRIGSIIASLLEIGGALLALVFCGWLVWRGLDAMELMRLQGRKTESLVFLLWPFFAMFLVGMAFLGISFVFQLYHEVCVLLGKEGLVDEYHTEGDEGAL